MKQEKKEKNGHVIVTYQVRLYDRHFAWLHRTKELYSKVVEHFFSVVSKEKHLLELSDFLLLRELETKCIGTKERKAQGIAPEYPLTDFPKIPLYFRRSAINAAIDLARKQAWSILTESPPIPLQTGVSVEQENNQNVYHAPMTLYQGMYQNFTDTSIELKLFNGERWVWVIYPFTGRKFPTKAKRLSPVLVLKKNNAYLNVPISLEVSDIRTIKERMQTEERICAVSFPDYDVLAVAVILSKEGKELEKKFFRGGKQKEYQRKQILRKIQESKQSRKKKQEDFLEETEEKETKSEEKKIETSVKENAYWYEKLHNLNTYYAHNISRQIVDYCVEKEIRIIVVPKYESSIDFRDKRYLTTDAYRWLGRSIIKNLKYKAFACGMVVTSIRPIHISDCCSECGAKIRKYNEGHVAGRNYHGGKLFLCPNGHKGNTAENTAKNIGKTFLSFYS